MSNDDKLKAIITDVLLLGENEYLDANGPEEIDTWDSLASVNLATRIAESFAVEVTPEELTAWMSIGDIKQSLRQKGHDLT